MKSEFMALTANVHIEEFAKNSSAFAENVAKKVLNSLC